MTAEAVGRDPGVVEGRGRGPALGRMAEFALISRLEMIRVLASRDRSVVTGRTVCRDRGMIEVGGDPAARRVAGLAIISARNMSHILSRRGRTVVTARAVRRDPRVVEGRGGGPALRRMAELTIVSGLEMIRVLAPCGRPVVTAHAIRRDRRMIEVRGGPGTRSVTDGTIGVRREMPDVLSRCRRAVVAARTIRGHRRMIETSATPAPRSVTVAASIRALDMAHGFARRHSPDMTGLAILTDGSMIHASGLPEAGRVATAAIRLNGNMTGRATRFRTIPDAAMAGLAESRRSRKLPAEMAGLAGGPLVSARQGESRQIMIEGRGGLARRGRREENADESHPHPNEPNPILLVHPSRHRFAPLLFPRPNVAGFQASSEWQSSQLLPNPPRWMSSLTWQSTQSLATRVRFVIRVR